jgi:hypothetical protein
LKQQRLAWAVVLWQESSGEGQEENESTARDLMFMFIVPARTDCEAPKAEMAYLDKERREGIVLSDTDSKTEEDDDCWGTGASFILATQAIVH